MLQSNNFNYIDWSYSMTNSSEPIPTMVLNEKELPALVLESPRVHVEIHSDGRILVSKGTVELGARACFAASDSRAELIPPRPATPGSMTGTTYAIQSPRPVATPRAITTPFASLVRLATDAQPRKKQPSQTPATSGPSQSGENVFHLASPTGQRPNAAVSRVDECAIGERLPDGTIYAGISPSTGWPMYTTSSDSSLFNSWTDAMNYAANVTMHGHDDWRAPTKRELHHLFTHRAAIGNFNEKGHLTRGRYWSSSPEDMTCAWAQSVLDRSQVNTMALRCVRG